MKNFLSGFFAIGWLIFFSSSEVYALEPSLVIECNEEVAMMNVYQSVSNFSDPIADHDGWSLASKSKKIRIYIAPFRFRAGRIIQQACQIKDILVSIEIRRIERNSNRDECDDSVRIGIFGNKNKVFDDIPLGFSGCVDEDSYIEKIHITKANSGPKNIEPGLGISGSIQPVKKQKNSSTDEFVFNVITDKKIQQIYRIRKRIVLIKTLPLNNSNFNDFLKSQE